MSRLETVGGQSEGALGTKIARVTLATILAFALVPAFSLSQAFASDAIFIGTVHYPVKYDEDGYPMYNEDGSFQRGNPYVTLKNVENASGTLVVPRTFDLVVRAEDGTETIERNVEPSVLYCGGTIGITGPGLQSTWTNADISSLDLTQCSTLKTVDFSHMDSIESVSLDGLSALENVAFSSCKVLRTASMDGCSSVTSYRLEGCDSLALPDFSGHLWSSLEQLTIRNRDDLTVFDGGNLPELTDLTISSTSLELFDVSACSKLKYMYLSQNKLTEVDMARIPASVETLQCQYNYLFDTAALEERFGARNVLPQNDSSAPGDAARLSVIGEGLANGILLPGEEIPIYLEQSYTPSLDEQATWWQDSQDWSAAYASENFTATSSDPSVACIEFVDEDEYGPARAKLSTFKTGTTTLTIGYRYAVGNQVYTAQQVVDFMVVASANPITAVTCASSVEVPFVSQCAICDENHTSVDGGMMVPLQVTAQDTSRPVTYHSYVTATVADESVVRALPIVGSEYAVHLSPLKIGSTTVTLVGSSIVNGKKISTDPVIVQVNVVESPKPTLNISKTFGTTLLTEYSEDGSATGLVPVVSPDGRGIASYEDNDALKQIIDHHGNAFAYGYPTGFNNQYPAVYSATSDNEDVVSIVSAGNRELSLQMNAPGTANVTIKDVWGNEDTCAVTVKNVATEVQKLSLSHSELTVKVGETIDLSTFVQGKADIDPLVHPVLVFKPDNGYIAPVKHIGNYNVCSLLGRNVGDVKVTAGLLIGSDWGGSLDFLDRWETADFGTLTVHVVPADTPAGNPVTAVEVTGASDAVEMGSSLQLSAAITPVDADNADALVWTSSDTAVASVDASGKVTPVAPGTVTITATVGSVSGTFEVTVVERKVPATGVTISTADDAMEVGDTQQLTAAVEPADSTDAVEWFSADESVLTVDQSGLVTAVGNGTTVIGVRAGSVEDETYAITATTPVSGVSLDKQALELYAGADASKLVATVAPATASNQEVSWTSSDSTVATVDDGGNVAPVAPGTATITATTRDGALTATCKVTVKQHVEGIVLDAHELTLTGVQTTPLKATVSPYNATNKGVTWTSSNEGVATVDADGAVTATGKGTTTITATTEDGAFSDACAVTVSNPATKLTLDPATLALIKGETCDVAAVLSGELAGEVDDAGAIAWSSSNKSAAMVVDGAVTAVASGAATITAEATVGGAKLAGTCMVTVTNPVRSVAVSETSKTATVGDGDFSLMATVSPSDADDPKVTWASSNTKVATVDANGTVAIHAVGSADIVASAGGKSAACALTVKVKEMAQTPQGSGFSASVMASDVETVKALEQLAGDGGLNLVVDSIAQLTGQAKAAVEKLAADGAVVVESFDIHFAADDGQEIVLAKDDEGRVVLTVRVKLTDSMRALLDQGMKLQVHYVGDNGAVEDKETWVEDGYLCFVTEHFSDYVVTGVPQKEEGGAGDSGSGDSDQTLTSLPTGDGSSLAPTGDPLGTAALVIGGLACLAAAAIVCVRRKVR